MVILINSCDRNADLYEAFYKCMEKYGPNHPKIVYNCETIPNPYYECTLKNYTINQGTKRIREALEAIDDDIVLMMCDDCFIRTPVNGERIKELSKYVKDNVAYLNFEKSFDKNDTPLDDFVYKRYPNGEYRISVMCGLGDRKKLIDLLDGDTNPWTFEITQKCKNYDYLILKDELVLDFGHYKTGDLWGLGRGKGMRELQRFFEKEGIKVDYSKREFYDKA